MLRYRCYKDELKLRAVVLPTGFYHLIFGLPMAAGLSAKEKAARRGMPHLFKPDKDNLEKAVLDGLFDNDSHVWDGRVSKLWSDRGVLIVSEAPIDISPPFNFAPFIAAAYHPHASLVRYHFAATFNPSE